MGINVKGDFVLRVSVSRFPQPLQAPHESSLHIPLRKPYSGRVHLACIKLRMSYKDVSENFEMHEGLCCNRTSRYVNGGRVRALSGGHARGAARHLQRSITTEPS